MSNGYTMGYYAPAVKKATKYPTGYGGYGQPVTQTTAQKKAAYVSTLPGFATQYPKLATQVVQAPKIPTQTVSPTYVPTTSVPTTKRATTQPVVAGAGVVTGVVTGDGRRPPEDYRPPEDTGIGEVAGGYTPYSFQMPEIDMARIWGLSGQMADMEINPQLEELDRYLQDAGYTAEESNTAINQAYPLMKREIQKSIFENQVTAQQNLAGAGTLRGGAMGELGARGMEREAIGIEGLGQERSRQLETIRKRLGTITENVGQQRVGLEARRGTLKNVYAENMRQRAFDEQMQQYNAAESMRQFNENMALQRDQMAQQLQIAKMGGSSGGGGGGAGAGVTGYTPTQTGYTYPSADQIYKSYIEAGYSPAAAGKLMTEQGLMSATGARQTAQSVATSLYPETYAWWLKQPTVQPWSNVRGKAYGY
jgi:hypothetical protein